MEYEKVKEESARKRLADINVFIKAREETFKNLNDSNKCAEDLGISLLEYLLLKKYY